MSQHYASATLLTSDHYLPGALALAAALKDVHPVPPVPPEVSYQTVCIITPETVDISTIKQVRRAYDVVIGVEVIEQLNDAGLRLLGRLDLYTVLTKLHVFRLTQYDKIIFLDADVLPVRPLSHLFTLPHEFSAVPDIGWPDIFNSGVMVLTPGEEKFKEIMELVKTKGSWDGGDQGVLNEWRGNNWNRLSFTYNTTPTGSYMFAPAYERFGSQISAIHFIGPHKPWEQIPYRAPLSSSQTSSDSRPSSSSVAEDSEPKRFYGHGTFLDRWFDVYDRHYRQPAKPLVQQQFEVRRYENVWDEPAQSNDSSFAESSGGDSLGLDDLRRLALQGGTGSTRQEGEGEYHSLPLDGRIDLMRPKVELPPEIIVGDQRGQVSQRTGSKEHREDSSVSLQEHSRQNLGTPEPRDIPPSPRITPLSLPPSYPPSPFPEPGGQLGGADSYFERQSSERRDQHHDYSRGDTQGQRQEDQHYHPHSPRGDGGQQGGHGSQHHEYHGSERFHQQQEQHYHEHHHEHHEQRHEAPPPSDPPRPPSPPMINWNPAVEPPPNIPPTPSAFPKEQYFTNAWDVPPSTAKLYADVTGVELPYRGSFFQAPPPSQIPQHLIREGHYSNSMGSSHQSSQNAHRETQHKPDITRVQHVFPWEQKPRHTPGRVFPEGEKAPGALYIEDMPPPEPVPETPEAPPIPFEEQKPESPNLHIQIPPPPAAYPGSRGYSNAWDYVPSIQRYASRLVKPQIPTPQYPPLPPSRGSRRRSDSYRSRGEQSDANSMDGDVEDEVDDDEEENTGRYSSSERSENGPRPSKRERNGSKSPPIGSSKAKTSKKEYRSFGVQTLPKDVRSVGVQVSQSSSLPPTGSKVADGNSQMSQKKAGKLRARHSSTSSSSHLELPKNNSIIEELKLGPEQLAAASPGLANVQSFIRPPHRQNQPSGVISPRMADTYGYESPNRTPRGSPVHTGRNTPSDQQKPALQTIQTSTSAQRIAPPPSLSNPPSLMARTSSTDTNESFGPISPTDISPLASSQTRKTSGRQWNPATGVDVFKRGSEEVLARFLRMGSWEEESPTGTPPAQHGALRT